MALTAGSPCAGWGPLAIADTVAPLVSVNALARHVFSATLRGSVNSRWNPAAAHFEVRSASDPEFSVLPLASGSSFVPSPFSFTLAPLRPNTDYLYRAVASQPDGSTSRGASQSFRTPGLPVLPYPIARPVFRVRRSGRALHFDFMRIEGAPPGATLTATCQFEYCPFRGKEFIQRVRDTGRRRFSLKRFRNRTIPADKNSYFRIFVHKGDVGTVLRFVVLHGRVKVKTSCVFALHYRLKERDHVFWKNRRCVSIRYRVSFAHASTRLTQLRVDGIPVDGMCASDVGVAIALRERACWSAAVATAPQT